MPSNCGTSGQICTTIQTNPEFANQLDRAIVSGKKTLERSVGFFGGGKGDEGEKVCNGCVFG
jgi:hypothetical protein